MNCILSSLSHIKGGLLVDDAEHVVRSGSCLLNAWDLTELPAHAVEETEHHEGGSKDKVLVDSKHSNSNIIAQEETSSKVADDECLLETVRDARNYEVVDSFALRPFKKRFKLLVDLVDTALAEAHDCLIVHDAVR